MTEWTSRPVSLPCNRGLLIVERACNSHFLQRESEAVAVGGHMCVR